MCIWYISRAICKLVVESLEYGKEDCLFHGVWVMSVDKLKGQLKTSMSLVPAQLEPQLIGRKTAFMPCQATFRSMICNSYNLNYRL